ESEARLRFDNQIARLTHQAEFEKEGLNKAAAHLENVLRTERANLGNHEAQKAQVDRESKILRTRLRER
ncbi:hypothetical protein JOM56_001108, partial [Amanita muscaria]